MHDSWKEYQAMPKNRFVITALFCALSVSGYAASSQIPAWQLTTWAKTAGGQVTSRNVPVPQTSAYGSVFKTYTCANVPVTVTPNAGYTISNITVDGTNITWSLANPASSTSITPPPAAGANHTVTASFSMITYFLTAAGGGGGTVSPAGMTVYPGVQSPAKSFTFTPSPGEGVESITGSFTSATSYKYSDALTGAAITAFPAPIGTSVKVDIASVAGNATLTGTFAPQVANAGANQNMLVGTPIILDGRLSTGAGPFAWTQVSGPVSVKLNGAASKSATFTTSVTGVYLFKLTHGTSATTTVYVANSPVQLAKNQCVICHIAQRVGPGIYANWSGSVHKEHNILCDTCHHASTGHPGTPVAEMGNSCLVCHNTGGHPVDIGSNTCVFCHDAHSATAVIASINGAPHYNNITSAYYPASYVSSKSNCNGCHIEGAANKTIRLQWKATGHGLTTDKAWSYDDFKTMAGCVTCHTTTGFIAYSTGKVTSAWGNAADKTKEVLRCDGCHNNVVTGEVRTVSPVKPYADETGYTNRDVGMSNICMACHSGPKNGRSIISADFSTQPFIAPHYLSSGGTLHGKAGYHFPGKTYAFYSSNTHRRVGMGNFFGTGIFGPCTTCHMTSSRNHSLATVSMDQTGAATAIVTPVCTSCHGSALDTTLLNSDRAAFANALDVLKAGLASKGFVFSGNDPFFNNTNWGTGQAGANTMGAAFNYVLLRSEPGAYVHNSAYAKQLIADSIVAVCNDGSVSGSIDDALAGLVGNGITQTQSDNFKSYQEGANCKTCHATLSGSHDKHVGDLLDSVTTYGDGGNYSTRTIYRFGCATCHPTEPAMHMNGSVDVTIRPDDTAGTLRNKNILVTADGLNAAGSGITGTSRTNIVCNNVYCHSNGNAANLVYSATPSWYNGSFTGDKCASCHGNSPATGAHAAHVIGIHDNLTVDAAGNLIPAAALSGVVAAHGDPAQATTINCDICHSATVANNANDNNTACVSCHVSSAMGTPILDMTFHVNGTVDMAFKDIRIVTKAQPMPATFAKYSGVWTRSTYKIGAGSFDTAKQSLNQVVWDGMTKNCTNVACHNGGTPKWNATLKCLGCHSRL
jgi:trimeric autotransporter adhesin